MLSFVIVASVLLLGAISPGPDFIVVAKNSIIHSRRAGIYTALGVGSAVWIHATYALLGLGLIMEQSIVLFSIIKWTGALYLLYLGVSLLRSKSSTLPSVETKDVQQDVISSRRAFLEGFATNLLNPKAVFFFVGVFAQVISPDASVALKGIYILESVVVIGAWFVMLAWFLNISRFKAALQKIIRPVERVMGAILIALAAKVAFERV